MRVINKKRIIVIGSCSFFLLLFIIFVLWGLGILPSRALVLKEKLFPSTPNNLELSFKKCESTRKCQGYFSPYLNESKWQDDQTFYAKITIPANYGDIFWIGDYQISGEDTLILKYRNIQGAFMACGYCPVELEYRITDIPYKEYKVVLE